MKKIYLLAILTVLGCSTHKGPYMGKYRIKYASYGMFGKTIELKADSTFIKNFRGDMMNDYSYGRWTMKGDTLLLAYDTIAYPKSRYKGTESYFVRGKKLIEPDYSLVPWLKEKGVWDSLTRKQKRQAERIKNLTPIDFKGTIRKNYYRLLEDK